MDLPIIYIVGGPTVDNRSNLRYSLRSIHQNAPTGPIHIVGQPPRWLRNTLNHPQPALAPVWEDVTRNIRYACELAPQWVLMHDDFYITQPVPQWHPVANGTATDFIKPNTYGARIRATGEWLTDHGYTDHAYDGLHAPQLIESWAMLEALEICRQTGLRMFQTIAGNIAGHNPHQTVNAKSDDGWKNRPYVSTSDDRWLAHGGVADWIRAQFPNPSPYETS